MKPAPGCEGGRGAVLGGSGTSYLFFMFEPGVPGHTCALSTLSGGSTPQVGVLCAVPLLSSVLVAASTAASG